MTAVGRQVANMSRRHSHPFVRQPLEYGGRNPFGQFAIEAKLSDEAQAFDQPDNVPGGLSVNVPISTI